MKIKTICLLSFLAVWVPRSVRGQPIELCRAGNRDCCRACCGAGVNAPELPAFVNLGGCKEWMRQREPKLQQPSQQC